MYITTRCPSILYITRAFLVHKIVLHHLRLLIKIVHDLGVLAGELVDLGLGELPGADAILEENVELGIGAACARVSIH